MGKATSETRSEFASLYRQIENVPEPVIEMNYDTVNEARGEAESLDRYLLGMERKGYRVNVDVIYRTVGTPPGIEAWHIELPEDLPEFGKGAKVTEPTLAWIGERGKTEYIIPENDLREGIEHIITERETGPLLVIENVNLSGTTTADARRMAAEFDRALADLWERNKSRLRRAMEA